MSQGGFGKRLPLKHVGSRPAPPFGRHLLRRSRRMSAANPVASLDDVRLAIGTILSVTAS